MFTILQMCLFLGGPLISGFSAWFGFACLKCDWYFTPSSRWQNMFRDFFPGPWENKRNCKRSCSCRVSLFLCRQEPPQYAPLVKYSAAMVKPLSGMKSSETSEGFWRLLKFATVVASLSDQASHMHIVQLMNWQGITIRQKLWKLHFILPPT